jgi:hypothetical protein
VNWIKIVPYFALGQFSTRNLATSALLLPLAVVTNFLGIGLARITRRSASRLYLDDLNRDCVAVAGRARICRALIVDYGANPKKVSRTGTRCLKARSML